MTKSEIEAENRLVWGGLSYCWHLWNIAKGRPKYQFIGDNGLALIVFSLVWLMAFLAFINFSPMTSMPWSLLDSPSQELFEVLFRGSWYFTVFWAAICWLSLFVLACRKTRADSLFCAYLGAWTLFYAGTALYTNLAPSRTNGVEYLLILIWMMHCRAVFFEMPAKVRMAHFDPRYI